MLKTLWSVSLSLVNNPKFGELLFPGSVQRKGHKAMVTRKNCLFGLVTLIFLLASVAVTFPVLRHRFKRELLGGIDVSKLVSFDRSLLSWLGVNTNEAVIRNLSLVFEYIAESSVKAVDA